MGPMAYNQQERAKLIALPKYGAIIADLAKRCAPEKPAYTNQLAQVAGLNLGNTPSETCPALSRLPLPVFGLGYVGLVSWLHEGSCCSLGRDWPPMEIAQDNASNSKSTWHGIGYIERQCLECHVSSPKTVEILPEGFREDGHVVPWLRGIDSRSAGALLALP